MQRMTRLLIYASGLLIGLGGFMVHECATAQKAAEPTTLRVGIEKDYAPFGFRDRQNQLVGFDVELLQAIAETVQLKITFVEVSWNGIHQFLEKGKSNRFEIAMSGITITPERQQHVLFSEPYFEAGQQVVIKRGDAINQLADLANKTLGAQSDTLGAKWITENLTTATLKTYPTALIALQAVVQGEIAALVHDLPVLAYLMKSDAVLRNQVMLIGRPLTHESYGIAAQMQLGESITKINQGLATVKQSGQYQQLFKKWFSPE